MALLNVEHLKKTYVGRLGANQVHALQDVSFAVEEGEFAAIMGESGSGKTTLLNILAALDKPTSGNVFLNMRDIVTLKEKEISAFRRDNLGFVFQDFNLLDTFSVQDNILLPLVLAGKKYPEMKERLLPIAGMLGIEALLQKYPGHHHPASAHSGRRAHWRSGLPLRRADSGYLRAGQQPGTDRAHGHPLYSGGKQGGAGAVYQGRPGVPPDLPGEHDRRPDVPEHL